MSSWRPLVITAAVVAALVAVVVVTRAVRRASPPAAPLPTPAPTPVPVRVFLFFPGDDDLLHREVREVPEAPAAGPARIRLVLEELLAGSQTGLSSAFPRPATVDAVFLDAEGNAYVDLSPPPAELVTGTATEVALVYGTVATVVANCPGVARVQLLFGGHEVDTLGHLDLSRPLAPRTEMVAP